MSDVEVGDVVMISADAAVNEGLRLCLAVVEEVKPWGVKADVHLPAGVAPVRLRHGDYTMTFTKAERLGADDA